MTKQHRLVLIVSILASGVAFLDGSVVNVALPAIVRDLGGGLSVQQWVVDAYLITLGSLILIAGSLSDLFGRKRIMNAGLIGFLVTSILCAVAPNSPFLILMRGLQGIAGALLVPSSLALIMSEFEGSAQGKAVGSWTAWTGISFVVGPLLGGFLVDTASWRLIFAINILPIAVTLWLLREVRQADHPRESTKVDIKGAILCAIALSGIGYALIEQGHYGWSSLQIYGSLITGLLAGAGFIAYQAKAKNPMLPLSLFKVRNFWTGNIATVAIYGGLSIATFVVVIFLQQFGGYSAIKAGLALLPVTIIMFFLSPKIGALSSKLGPRLFMTLGPLLASTGFFWMLMVHTPVQYWTEVFPGVILFGLGLSVTVAPLTSAILGAIGPRQAGIASAVNNAVARIAGLLAIAALSIIAGSSLNLASFHRSVLATALLLVAGGVISFLGIRNPKQP